MKAADLAYLSLVRRSSSSLLAVLAIAAAIGVSGTLVVLQETMSETFSNREQGIDVLIGPKSSGLQLLLDGLYFSAREGEIIGYQLQKTIKEEVGPKLIVPFALFAEHQGVPLIGTDDSILDWLKHQGRFHGKMVARGRWFNLHTDDPEVVLGARAAQTLGVGPDDRFRAFSNLTGRDRKPIWDRTVRVVGVLAETGQPHDGAMFTPIENAWEAHYKGYEEGIVHPGKKVSGVSWFSVVLDPDKMDQLEEMRALVQGRSVAQFIEVDRELNWLRSFLGQGRNLTGAMAILSLFLASTVLLLLFVERSEMTRRELGLYRALGYSRKEISMSILWESFYLGVVGLSLGMILERVAHLMVRAIWNPPWLSVAPWPSSTLIFLWISTLAVILLIPSVAIFRLYRIAASEALAAS